MTQIAFESAFDPFHAAFRVLRQCVALGDEPMGIARAKILDVYIAEPKRCVDIRLPQGLKRAARLAAQCQPSSYGHRPSVNSFFDRMSVIQDAAIQTLVLQGLLDADAFSVGSIQLTDDTLPSALAERIEIVNEAQRDLMKFLLKDLKSIPFAGRNGLKDRTQLGEFRYDVA